jgi:hypothetical protein
MLSRRGFVEPKHGRREAALNAPTAVDGREWWGRVEMLINDWKSVE